MSIDLTKDPYDLIAGLISSKNTALPTLTKGDINIRRITAQNDYNWTQATIVGWPYPDGYPAAKYIGPDGWQSRDNAEFVTRKTIYFPGGTVDFHIRSDNSNNLYIDGELKGSGVVWTETYIYTVELTEGPHEVVISSHEITGGAGLTFAIDDGVTQIYSDTTWEVLEIPVGDSDKWIGDLTDTSIEVDLLIAPSESYGDFVTFNYNRIPIEKILVNVDALKNVAPYEHWNKLVESKYITSARFTEAMLVSPVYDWTASGDFVTMKDVTVTGTSLRILSHADDSHDIYIDKVKVATNVGHSITFDKTYEVTSGTHELMIKFHNDSSGGFIEFVIYDGDTVVDKSDTTWGVVEVDVDYTLAELLQSSGNLTMELDYDLSELSMLTDSISNSAAIYDNWYRFSHNSSKVYPAKESEIEGWTYDADNDCIVSTINSSTHVGFISDDTSDNYTFNTVLSSNNRDDDNINIVIAAKKQGEYDDDEHVLSVNVNTGGVQTYVGIYQDHVTTTNPIVIMDPSSETANKGDGWRYKYAHVYIEREGNIVKVWVKRYDDATLSISDNDLRDSQMVQHTDDLSLLKESDFASLNYLYAELDLSVSAPMFVGPCHYGYAQYSQSLAKFWNIKRPNENPAITPALQAHLIRRYGVNLGDTGVEVSSLGNNSYQIDVDNVVYLGSFTMSPITE